MYYLIYFIIFILSNIIYQYLIYNSLFFYLQISIVNIYILQITEKFIYHHVYFLYYHFNLFSQYYESAYFLQFHHYLNLKYYSKQFFIISVYFYIPIFFILFIFH